MTVQTSETENYRDLNHFETVAKVMARELSGFRLASDPLDVAETIEQLTEEMEDMPRVIGDCRRAVEAFGELEGALDRMYSLADRAAELDDSDPALLASMDAEFSGYAHIVARLAGAGDFDGPCLSLATSAEAMVTRTVLACLTAARHGFAEKLEEQRRHINSAMGEAMELLARILEEGEEISLETRNGLNGLLDTLKIMDRGFGPAWQEQRPAYLN
ncbi:MAG: hypothetical protein LBQ12_12705 [Deltaproteobacteria bacterium]|jgi:hypothetical protein|nr:hypothetical protein [Deltaproteobacteria bacterium]